MKVIFIIFSISIFFLPIFFTLSFAGIAQQRELTIDGNALILYDNLRFKDVVDLYEKNTKINNLSPYSLIFLCSALNELEYDLEEFLLKHNSSGVVKDFSLAFTNLLNGKADVAKVAFHKLRKASGRGFYYGTIGLFETALFLSDQSALKKQIEELKGDQSVFNEDIHQAILYYTIVYYKLIGNMSGAMHLMEDVDSDDSDRDFGMLIASAEILIAQNRLKDALKLVDDVIKVFGPLQDAILLKYRLICLKDGEDIGALFLNKMIRQNDRSWQLKLTKYFQELDSLKNNSHIVSDIIKIAKSRRHDIQSLLMICNELLDYGYYAEAGKLMNIFFRNTDNQSNFFMSNFFMTKFYFSSGGERFNVSHDAARRQSPKDYGLLWFEYFLAMEKRKNTEAFEILDQLLSFDPFDSFVLYKKIVLNVSMNKWQQVLSDIDKITQSRRYLDPEMKRELVSLRNKALAQLNN